MKNLAASVRQRLLNLSKAKGEEFHQITLRFAYERLLYRLGQSRHKDRFVLKGALLFALMGETYRPTRDMDLLGFGSDDLDEMLAVFGEVMALDGQDGLVFDLESLKAETIRDQAEYGGIRIQMRAYLDTARIPLQVDIGFGDAITPPARELAYPTLLELPPPQIRAYPLETVVAEKFQAMVSLGMVNTRMKDYLDLWVISNRFELEAETLRQAITNTFTRRKTELPESTPTALSDTFTSDSAKQAVWRAFTARVNRQGLELEAVVMRLREFLEPISIEKAGGSWNPEKGSWQWTLDLNRSSNRLRQ